MNGLNPTLLSLARHQVWKDAKMEKVAVVPPGGDPTMDPTATAGGGGAPPPGMGGGGPPPGMDPSQMGGQPPMGQPPMAPPPQQAPMQPPNAAAGAIQDPATAMAQGQPAPKMKPEQMMQMLDFRLYNIQMQLTAIMNAQGVTLPPGALVTPPGSPTPVAEAAVPGGAQDPSNAGGGQGGGGGGGGGGGSSISPIGPIQGASPDLAGGGGGATKSGSYQHLSFSDLIEKLADNSENDDDEDIESEADNASDDDGEDDEDADSQSSFDPQTMGDWMDDNTKTGGVRIGTPYGESFHNQSPGVNAAAIAAMLRGRTGNA